MTGTRTPQLQHVVGARAKLATVVFVLVILNTLMMFLRLLYMVAHFARVAGVCFPQVYSRFSGTIQRLGEGGCHHGTALSLCMPGLWQRRCYHPTRLRADDAGKKNAGAVNRSLQPCFR